MTPLSHFWIITGAILCGVLLDLLFGDPAWLPHPVVMIGRMVDAMQGGIHRMFSKSPMGQIMAGAYLVLLILFDTIAVFGGLCMLGFFLHPLIGFAAEAIWCAQSLALRGLTDAGKKVFNALPQKGDSLDPARAAVGEIVGRDTDRLDEQGIIRATVETIAENASDGVCAPLFFMLIGGAPAAMVYKAINTMDSMIGYKNKKYFYFGKAAARLDDLANLLPSRLTAFCMMAAATVLPGYDAKAAVRIWLRDRHTQASPNAPQTESVMAGALGIELLGDASYFGEYVKKPTIGDARRPAERDDIHRANRLIAAASFLFLMIGLAVRILVGLTIIP